MGPLVDFGDRVRVIEGLWVHHNTKTHPIYQGARYREPAHTGATRMTSTYGIQPVEHNLLPSLGQPENVMVEY